MNANGYVTNNSMTNTNMTINGMQFAPGMNPSYLQKPTNVYQLNANKTPGLNICGSDSSDIVCAGQVPTYINICLFPQNKQIIIPERTIIRTNPKVKCNCGKPSCKRHQKKPLYKEIIEDPIPIRIGRPSFSVRFLAGSPSQASNVPSTNVDPYLIGSRGMTKIGGTFFVANNWTDKITSYDSNGTILNPQGVWTRSSTAKSSFPSGMVATRCGLFSTPGNDTTENGQYTAQIALCSETGSLHSLNSEINKVKTIIRYNQEANGITHTYTGLTIKEKLIFVADLFNGSIDAYNNDWKPVSLPPGSFIFQDLGQPVIDTNVYAPFNITAIGDHLFVCWAKKDIQRRLTPDLSGGYVSEFDTNGQWIKRFQNNSNFPLNAPWGIIQAPIAYNIPPNAFLVANAGDGRIVMYNACGEAISYLLNGIGQPIVIPGIWEILPDYCISGGICSAVDNAGVKSPNDKIYFTASKDPEKDGLFGVLEKLDINV